MEVDYSQEVILGRMLNSAVDLWGIKQNDHLDPVVRLMMEAFATEIFKVQQNIQVSHARLVEHLAEVLTPTKLTVAVPAHAVMHASCNSLTQIIDRDTPYEIAGGTIKDQKFRFTPIDNIKLCHAEVTDIITPSSACRLEDCIYKVAFTSPKAGSISQNHIWLGLSVSPQLHDLKSLSLFIDWPNINAKNELYKSLAAAKCMISGTTHLRMNQGLVYAVPQYGMENTLQKLETYQLILNDIKSFYQKRFFTVDQNVHEIQEHVQPYPALFKNYFSESQLQQFFVEKKLWLRIELPAYLEMHVLDDMLVNTNSFPVINREFKLTTINTTVIPLICEDTEQILSVGSVYGAIHGSYQRMELRDAKENSNTYTFKRAGLERFDKRNAYELVKYLELLLKNEVQAFISLNKGNSQELIDALNAVVGQTKKIAKSEGNKALQYVMLEKEILDEVVTAEFWVTQCAEANQIRIGTIAQNIQDSNQLNCWLLTPTTGGKDSQSEGERIRAYQYALLTKEQIVSAQDIKSFIYYQLGERALFVDVKNGLTIGQDSKHGLLKSVNIYIDTNDQFKEDTMERQVVGDTLLQKLQQQSDPSRVYRLFWNERK